MSVTYADAARADLGQIEDDLLRAGAHVLRLFHQRLARALSLYESSPLLAPEYQPPDPRLPGMRYFPIRRFDSYALYYQPTADGIRVVRVLHTSRNIAAIFDPVSADPTTTPGS